MNTNILDNTSIESLGFTKTDEACGIVEYRLTANGLKVLLIEEHSTPVVSALIVYKVGSRNETAGHTGSAHFLEHMMFKGTTSHNLVRHLEPLGVNFNATTSTDRTNYFSKMPKRHLRKVLILEADRMRNLSLLQVDRDSEMSVVRNEFEIDKNDPGSLLAERLMATMFREHPYNHPVLGWLNDVENMSLAKLQEFYNTFYWPNNATLMITGDFDTLECLSIIAETYGQIPHSPHEIPRLLAVEPEQLGERRFKITQPSTAPPQVKIGFHIPAAAHQDCYALAALGRLVGGSHKRASRLYKALIETNLAVSCGGGAAGMLDPGVFSLSATCAPGVKAEVVEAALLQVIETMARELVSDQELQRVKDANRKASALVSDTQLALLNQLCHAEVISDWREFIVYDDKFDGVTPEMIRDVVIRYFAATNRTVGSSVPSDINDEVLELGPKVKVESTFRSQVVENVLANGLKVQVLPKDGSKTVALTLRVQAGRCFSPDDNSLVAVLTARLLNRGSQLMSKIAIAEELEEMSARLEFGLDTYWTNLSAKVVSSDFGAYLALVAQSLRFPLFNQSDLNQIKLQVHSSLMASLSNTDALASQKLLTSLYLEGSVHYPEPKEKLLASLEAITIDDVRNFYRRHYGPANTSITIVGGIDSESALGKVELAFGSWLNQFLEANDLAKNPQTIPYGPALTSEQSSKHVMVVPDKTSVSILIGLPSSIKLGTSDFYNAAVANIILGESTLSSRLGDVLRIKHGLTYGIRSNFVNSMFGDGFFQIALTVNPSNVDIALKLVEDVVAEFVSAGITDNELTEAIESAIGSFVVQLDSSSVLANLLNLYSLAGNYSDLLDNREANFRAVTKEAVNNFIRSNFDLSKAVTVVAGSI